MLTRIVQIEVHLSGISVRELADFEIDNDQATQSPMEEQQVDTIPFRADAEPSLAPNKCEVIAEFQEKSFEFVDERIFEIRFRVLILKVEEFQDEWISDLVTGSAPANLEGR